MNSINTNWVLVNEINAKLGFVKIITDNIQKI